MYEQYSSEEDDGTATTSRRNQRSAEEPKSAGKGPSSSARSRQRKEEEAEERRGGMEEGGEDEKEEGRRMRRGGGEDEDGRRMMMRKEAEEEDAVGRRMRRVEEEKERMRRGGEEDEDGRRMRKRDEEEDEEEGSKVRRGVEEEGRMRRRTSAGEDETEGRRMGRGGAEEREEDEHPMMMISAGRRSGKSFVGSEKREEVRGEASLAEGKRKAKGLEGGPKSGKETTESEEEKSGAGTVLTRLGQHRFDHFSFTCHLFPRLSESNLQFHDIYWDRDPESKAPTLRKRRVCVNKLVLALVVRLPTGAGAIPQFRADLCLLDRRPFARRQIVSNIVRVPVPATRGSGLFRKVSPSVSPSVLVRSNYRQPEVALLLVLRRFSPAEEELGRVELDLLDAGGRPALPSRDHSHTFDGGIRLDFQTADLQARDQLQADSLPDVLICDQCWLSMLAIYRQLLCERLAQGGDIFADRSTWLFDPVLSCFPALLDTDPDAVELFLALLRKFDVHRRDLPPSECSRRFRFVFMQFLFPLSALIDPGPWRLRLRAFVHQKGGASGADEPNPFHAFATEPCRSLDVFEYALNLCADHAID